MHARILASLALVGTLVLAGCITNPGATLAEQDLDLGQLLPVEEGLWVDPQNAPHPAYNYPTLTNPPTGENIPAWWTPIPAANLTAIKGLEHVGSAEGVESGAGVALFGSLAVVPGFGAPTSVLDISDPASPKILSQFKPVKSAHRGAAMIPYPDGRLVTVISTGFGFEAWDITDPTTPELVSSVEPTKGGHKIGVVPGTPIVYNANSEGGASNGLFGPEVLDPKTGKGQTEIYDLTNPAEPVLVQEFKNGFGCHHIFFWNNVAEDKFRAVCAGIEYTQIWDTKDPLNPEVIVNVPVHHGRAGVPTTSVPIVAFSHFSVLNAAGTVLIVGDEMGGGSIPPGCTAPGAPTGALWFYDVKDEKNPKLLGWYSPGHHLGKSAPDASCTAHHGRLVPDPEGKRDLLAMSFYGAGVVLVDFTNPASAKTVDQWLVGNDVWETWYYNGYLFTGDLSRGFDVLTFKQ